MALDLSKLPDEEEIKNKLQPRVLDGLINEALKIQEANRLGIFVTNQEVTQQINRLESRLKLKKILYFQVISKKIFLQSRYLIKLEVNFLGKTYL